MKVATYFLLAGCLVLVGCGGGMDATGPTVSWSGTVTMGGKPLPDDLSQAVIQVRAKEQGANTAQPVQGEITKGRFALERVPQGVVIVRVILERKTGKVIREASGETFEEIVNLVPSSKRSGFEMVADKSDSDVQIAL